MIKICVTKVNIISSSTWCILTFEAVTVPSLMMIHTHTHFGLIYRKRFQSRNHNNSHGLRGRGVWNQQPRKEFRVVWTCTKWIIIHKSGPFNPQKVRKLEDLPFFFFWIPRTDLQWHDCTPWPWLSLFLLPPPPPSPPTSSSLSLSAMSMLLQHGTYTPRPHIYIIIITGWLSGESVGLEIQRS